MDRLALTRRLARAMIVIAIAIAPLSRSASPSDRTTVIKKEDNMGNRSKTVIHHDND